MCALFAGSRDVSLVRHLGKELINNIINTEVIVYQLSLEETRENIYGESNNKVYYKPVRVNCIVDRAQQASQGDDYGINYSREAVFAFARDTLVDIGIVIKSGDIIGWDNQFFELKNVASNYLWSGRNPESLLHTVEDKYDEFGYNIEVVAEGVQVNKSMLNIEETRSGNNQKYDLPPNFTYNIGE